MKADPKGSASAIAIALALVAGALAGCGGDPEPQGVGDPVGGSIAALAQCRDWNAGTEEEKQATIDDIASSLTPQSSPESGTSLSDERAYELFERSCTEDWAQGFELYKLYARAAAFAPLTEP